MLGYLILLFTLVPLLELVLLLKVGQLMGVIWTIGIVVITGITGACLARLQGFLTLRRIEQELNSGRMPADQMFDGVLIFLSGILLLTPGFVTDILGFLGLIPISRTLLKEFLKRKFRKMLDDDRVITITSFKSR